MALGLNYVDIGIIVLIFLSALVGFIRGFVREALSLTIWVAAIVLTIAFAEDLSTKLPFTISYALAPLIIAAVLIFVGVLIVGSLVNYLVSKGLYAIGMGGLDRVLGGAFGVIRGALVVTLLVLLLSLGLTPFVTDNVFWKESAFVPRFKEGAEKVKNMIPADIEQKIKDVGVDLGIVSEEKKDEKGSNDQIDVE